jgi:hypothetical protein
MAAPLIRAFHDDNSDTQFSLQIAQRLTSELCSLSEKYDICRHFVSANSEAILFNFLGTLLDSNRLEIFPSCNLERIEGVAGEVAAQQALTLLDLFNDDFSHGPSGDVNWRDFGAMAGIQRRRRHKADNAGGLSQRPIIPRWGTPTTHQRQLLALCCLTKITTCPEDRDRFSTRYHWRKKLQNVFSFSGASSQRLQSAMLIIVSHSKELLPFLSPQS